MTKHHLNKIKLALDMDGILVDFVTGICRTFGKPDPYKNGFEGWDIEQAPEFDGISRNKMFSVTKDPSWWEELPKTEEADQIIDVVTRLFPIDTICICTSPTFPMGPSIDGKARWLEKHYPKLGLHRRMVPTGMKHFLASPWSILLDDADKNAKSFVEEGGLAVLYPRPWNDRRGDQWFNLEAELKDAIKSTIVWTWHPSGFTDKAIGQVME